MENPTKETEKKNGEIYEVKQHDRTLYTGNSSDCFIYVLKHQPQSVSWATRYGGWSIKKKE